jgi:hypothetical protein
MKARGIETKPFIWF